MVLLMLISSDIIGLMIFVGFLEVCVCISIIRCDF